MMNIFNFLFKKKSTAENTDSKNAMTFQSNAEKNITATPDNAKPSASQSTAEEKADCEELKKETSSSEKLMTSQLAALYLKDDDKEYKDLYLSRLIKIGFEKQNAEKLFDFECNVIRKHNKSYLLSPGFTKDWLFGLSQPFFLNYPKTKEDVLKEQFFTVSELCKITDEAEWHFWNSHEKCLNDEAWNEIFEWRLNGNGMKFAFEYLEMIEKETGIPDNELGCFVRSQGIHLSKYKWS